MKTYYANKDEWKKLRDGLIAEGRIGGSMVGTAVGCDPWKSPYKLWAELTGKIQADDISNKEAIVVGTDLEDYVAERFTRLTGKKVHRENCIITNDACPHLFASIDRKIANEESGLECKTASAYRDGAFQEGGFPDGYFRQVKTYLAVTGLTRWYLAVLIMGIDFRVFLITRDANDLENAPEWLSGVRLVGDEELADCEADAAEFIDEHVKKDIPPEFIGLEDERAAIDAIHGGESSGTIECSAMLDRLCEHRAALKKLGDNNSEELRATESQIVNMLCGHEIGFTGKYKVSYKFSDTRRLNKEAIEQALGGKIPDSYYKTTSGSRLVIQPLNKNFK